MNNLPILLICDNDIRSLSELKRTMTTYSYSVITASSKKEIFELLAKQEVDILISNVDLKDSDAITICQEIRSINDLSRLYIILYSDKKEDYIQIKSLNSGADDFLHSPIKSVLLNSRIKVALHRMSKTAYMNHHEQPEITIDFEHYVIIKNNQNISLSKKEFEIFSLLFSEPKKVFKREEIAKNIWNNGDIAKQRTIDMHIKNIRKIIGQEVIRTVKGIGYCIA